MTSRDLRKHSRTWEGASVLFSSCAGPECRLGLFFRWGASWPPPANPLVCDSLLVFTARYKLRKPASSYLSDQSLSLSQLISSSQTTKARLLHYFPPSEAEIKNASDDEPVDSWCGFHLDHSLLTGLCSVSLATILSVPNLR